MKEFQIMLEESAFDGNKVQITTKNRGVITGMFAGLDEFNTDSEKLGFCIDIDEHEYDVIFPDEIVSIVRIVDVNVISHRQAV